MTNIAILHLRAKCLLASAVLVLAALPFLMGITFSSPWSYRDDINLDGYFKYDLDVSKNPCNPSNFQHLVGLPSHVLPNFYFPADTLIVQFNKSNSETSSRYNRLNIQLDQRNYVRRVYCS